LIETDDDQIIEFSFTKKVEPVLSHLDVSPVGEGDDQGVAELSSSFFLLLNGFTLFHQIIHNFLQR
jgi:hypothetical protein